MGYPSAVERQLEVAERIRKQAYEGTPPEDTSPIDTPPEERHEAPPEPDYKKLYEEEKQRRMTLEGKYNAEVPELARSNRLLADQLADLKADISALRAERREPPPKPDEDDIAFDEQFPEVSKAMNKRIGRELSKRDTEIRTLREENAQLRSGISTVERRVERTEGAGFDEAMDRLVKDGDWRSMNSNGSEFLRWCNSEKVAGHSRYALMKASYDAGDYVAVASHFNDYIKAKNPGRPAEEPNDKENVGLPKPGSAATPPKGAIPEDKKPITRSFVKVTLKDIALGKYKNNPKRRKELEDMINDKQAKGLIIDG